jgi:hypothetical protein
VAQPFIGTSGYSVAELRGLLENLLGRQQQEIDTGYQTAEDLTRQKMRNTEALASSQAAGNVSKYVGLDPNLRGVMGTSPLDTLASVEDYRMTQLFPERAKALGEGFGQLAQLGLGRSQANQGLLGQAWGQQLGLNELFQKLDAQNKAAGPGSIGGLMSGLSPLLNLIPGIGPALSVGANVAGKVV